MKAELLTTAYAGGVKKEEKVIVVFKADDGAENNVVNLYPGAKFQDIAGFGGAFTDSAGYVFSLMDEPEKRRLAETYYGADGIGYSLGRLHFDSCDFSLGQYEAIEPGDATLGSFSLERPGKYILPLAKAAQNAFGGRLPFMASMWSPPAFMKTNGQRIGGGSLKPEFMKLYAGYICRYVKSFAENGVNVSSLSPQNEPKAVQTWDSCIYTAKEEKAFIRDFLYPALEENGLGNLGIYIWDHNKERVYERVKEIIDGETDGMVEGVAFHWYSGDHFEALDLVSREFPGKTLAQTEACIEFSHYGGNTSLDNAERYAHDMIGGFNAGMGAFYDWNLLLDEEGGPNHVGNFCEAPFMYDKAERKLIESCSLSYIAHFSRYVKPGARRIGYSKYAANPEIAAFINPDGSIAAVILNKTRGAFDVVLRINGMQAGLRIKSRSISTLRIMP